MWVGYECFHKLDVIVPNCKSRTLLPISLPHLLVYTGITLCTKPFMFWSYLLMNSIISNMVLKFLHLYPHGLTIHWKLKWHVWITMKSNPSIRALQRQQCTHTNMLQNKVMYYTKFFKFNVIEVFAKYKKHKSWIKLVSLNILVNLCFPMKVIRYFFIDICNPSIVQNKWRQEYSNLALICTEKRMELFQEPRG